MPATIYLSDIVLRVTKKNMYTQNLQVLPTGFSKPMVRPMKNR